QRVMHPLVTHRDAVGYRDGAELEWEPLRGVHPLLRRLGEPLQREVARRDLVPRGGDPDLRLPEVLVAHPECAQHATRCGSFDPVSHFTTEQLTDVIRRLITTHGLILPSR